MDLLLLLPLLMFIIILYLATLKSPNVSCVLFPNYYYISCVLFVCYKRLHSFSFLCVFVPFSEKHARVFQLNKAFIIFIYICLLLSVVCCTSSLRSKTSSSSTLRLHYCLWPEIILEIIRFSCRLQFGEIFLLKISFVFVTFC